MSNGGVSYYSFLNPLARNPLAKNVPDGFLLLQLRVEDA